MEGLSADDRVRGSSSALEFAMCVDMDVNITKRNVRVLKVDYGSQSINYGVDRKERLRAQVAPKCWSKEGEKNGKEQGTKSTILVQKN